MFDKRRIGSGRRWLHLAVAIALVFGIASAGLNSMYADGAAVQRMTTAGSNAARLFSNEMKKGEIVYVDDTRTSIHIGPYANYLEDESGRFTISDVVWDKAPQFRKSSARVINFGLSNSVYWIRFTLFNALDHETANYLMIGNPVLDEIRLYEPDGRGGFSMRKTGDIYPFNQREIANANFVFLLKQKPGETTYYLRIASVTALTIPIMVKKDFTKSVMLNESTADLRPNTVLVSRDKTERIVSGRTAPIRDHSGKILGYVIIIRDITDETKFHSELMKIEKLESIGILAGGIAHDFNNILTAIMGNITLAKLIINDNPRLNEILANDKIMSQCREFGFKGVIAKPYRIDELARVVEQVMSGK